MSIKQTLVVLAALAGLNYGASAAISVPPGGTTPNDFPALPTLVDGWSTLSVGTSDANVTSAAGLDSAVQALTAASIATPLGQSASVNPPTTATIARWNSASLNVQTRPTGNDYLVLMATLQNDTGGEATALTISYDFGRPGGVTGAESVAGHRVYFSTTGNANSWQLINALSTGTPGSLSATFSVGSWPDTGIIYVLWADDNATGTDYAYTIDNISFTASVAAIPLSVSLTSPNDGAVANAPANLTIAAATGGTVPATSVSFYTNGALFTTIAAPGPFSASLSGLPAGNYVVYAEAVNDAPTPEVAYSTTNTFKVREPYAYYTGSVLTEDFSGMGTAGTDTPYGWYVGRALPVTGTTLTVDDGSTAANAAILGFNYGASGDSDRALGTAPTGADYHTEVRIQNRTGSNIVSFVVTYDGETWRTKSDGVAEVLTNFYSFDNGATWVEAPVTFQYNSPVATPYGAMNGNDSANRVADITDTVTPPNPIAPFGIVRVRFFNRNDGGTDGGMAVDNFRFEGTSFSEVPFFASIDSPTEGQSAYGGCTDGTVNLTVTASGSALLTNISFQLDGGAVVDDSTAPFSHTFTGLTWGNHQIIAVATDAVGNSTNMVRNFTVVPNTAPVIAITNSFAYDLTNGPGVAYKVGDSVTNQLLVADDGGVTNVDWYVNGTLRLSIPSGENFTTILLNDVLAGTSLIYAVATDSCGLVTTSAVVSVVATNPAGITVIVPNGSVWSYHNTNFIPVMQDLTNWYDVGYDASAWATGAGEIGGGDASSRPEYNGTDGNNPETTVIDIGAGTRFLGVYFRHTFNVANPAAFTNLIVRALRDDGIVVYLNGVPILTNQMTATWPTAYDTLASGSANDGTLYFEANVDPALLVSGQNVLAAEVHQNSTTSTDLSFDLMLWGQEGVTSVPDLAIVNNGDGSSTISWANTGTFRVFSSADVAAPRASWTEWTATTPTLNGGLNRWELIVPSNAGVRFFDLRP